MSPIGVFVSFDVSNDGELFELLVAQAGTAGFDFEVLGGSIRSAGMSLADEGVRRQIQEADQMIVLCGEHSEASFGMAEELRVAREEETPYILLWGRRASTTSNTRSVRGSASVTQRRALAMWPGNQLMGLRLKENLRWRRGTYRHNRGA